MEEPLVIRIRARTAELLSAAAGTPVPLARVKPSDTAPLASSAFVADGTAAALLPGLRSALPACLLDGVPLFCGVAEQNGWLLFDFSDAWWEQLCVLARRLPLREDGSYLYNRMRILARHGLTPCPAEPAVRRALWLAWLAHDAGAFSAETERAILSMTRHLTGMPRVRLQHACGGVAAAILHLKGDTPCG